MTALVTFHDRVFDRIDAFVSGLLLPTAARFVFAAVLLFYFWRSGLTKLGDGILGFLFLDMGVYIQMFPKAFEAAGYSPGNLGLGYKLIALAGTWAEFILPLMMHMGGDLPGFLEGFAPLAKYGYLADVARLELALRESYHAADADPVAPVALAALDAAALAGTRLGLAPALRLVESPWPIVGIWRFNMEGGAQPAARPESALVTRPGFDPRIEALSPGGAVLVAGLRAGTPLGPAVEAAAEAEPGFDPSATIGALFAGHAITALIPPRPDPRTDP
jgi:hypothetical protein